MATEVITLDARIRQQAFDSLTTRVKRSANPLLSEINSCWKATDSGLFGADGKPVNSARALSLIIASVISCKADSEQDKAVSEFIKKVDGLQEQIEELQGSVGQ